MGILKRLRGTPIIRHDAMWGMRYSPHPPYEILQTSLLDFTALQRLRRFGRFWDLFGNSGQFRETVPLLWSEGSPFAGLMRFSDWLHARGVQSHGIARMRQYELLGEFLGDLAAAALLRDFHRSGGTGLLPKRQARHLATAG